jgi:hypothetical protein
MSLTQKLLKYPHLDAQQVVSLLKPLDPQERFDTLLNLVGNDMDWILDFLDGFQEQKSYSIAAAMPKAEPMPELQKQSKPQKPNPKPKNRPVGNLPLGKTGKQICECNAQYHALFLNCLECGKIICKYEKADVCIFCGAQLTVDDAISNNIAALERKDRLLDYDKNFTRRTTVHDIAADFDPYFEVNSKWMESDDKDFLLKQKLEIEQFEEYNKDKRVLHLDFEKRQAKIEKVRLHVPKALPKRDHSREEGIYRNPNLTINAPVFVASKPFLPKTNRIIASLENLQDDIEY